MIDLATIDMAEFATMYMDLLRSGSDDGKHVCLVRYFGLESKKDWHSLRAMAGDLGLIPAFLHPNNGSGGVSIITNEMRDIINTWKVPEHG